MSMFNMTMILKMQHVKKTKKPFSSQSSSPRGSNSAIEAKNDFCQSLTYYEQYFVQKLASAASATASIVPFIFMICVIDLKASAYRRTLMKNTIKKNSIYFRQTLIKQTIQLNCSIYISLSVNLSHTAKEHHNCIVKKCSQSLSGF